MSDESKNPNQEKPAVKKKATVEPELTKTLSAQAATELHDVLETLNRSHRLDKSSVVRLALRLFIKQYYKGNGAWELPPDVVRDIVYAKDAVYCAAELNL